MESCRLTKGKDIGEPITHNLSLSFLKHAVTILQYSVDRDQLDNALSCVITLQVGVACGCGFVYFSFLGCSSKFFEI